MGWTYSSGDNGLGGHYDLRQDGHGRSEKRACPPESVVWERIRAIVAFFLSLKVPRAYTPRDCMTR